MLITVLTKATSPIPQLPSIAERYYNQMEHLAMDDVKHIPKKQEAVAKFTETDRSFAFLLILPPEIMCQIFNYLEPPDLLALSCVSRVFYEITNDTFLWQRKVVAEANTTFCALAHNAHPALFKDSSYKEMYLRCGRLPRPRHGSSRFSKSALLRRAPSRLTAFLSTFIPRAKPKLAMIGPGLESAATSSIVKIIMNDARTFTVCNMFPGHNRGFGCGFTYKLSSPVQCSDVHYFDMTMLYSNNRAERRGATTQRARLTNSHFFTRPNDDDNPAPINEQSTTTTLELSPELQSLCLTLDCIVYVVDASMPSAEIAECSREIYALAQQLWMKPRLPFLILSLMPHGVADSSAATTAASLPDVVRLLRLEELSGVWRIYSAAVGDVTALAPAFEWAIKESQYVRDI